LCTTEEIFKSGTFGEVALTPREITRALEPSLGIAISIVNPNFSFSVSGTMNDQPVMFLVDTGSALTILRRDTWERCKKPDQQLVPWSQSRLIGAEGSQLHVFGSADMTLNLEGEKFDLCVVVIYPLTSEGLVILPKCTVDISQQHLITGAGNVVNMSCQTKKVE